MTEHPIDPTAGYTLKLGWPLCECGHSIDLHGGGSCRRVECLGVNGGPRCDFYRPATPIKADSPAAFADAVRGMMYLCLPREAYDYDRRQASELAGTMVAQLAVQWKGWPEPDRTICGGCAFAVTDALTELDALARLGNGTMPGNSEGNRIAQRAAAALRQAFRIKQ